MKEEWVERVFLLLRKKRLTISVAESCTGGYLSYLLTKIPESSAVFKGGVVAYSYEAKEKFLFLPKSLVEENDGVSERVAELLAKNVRAILNTDLGVGIVGFAGPKAREGERGVVFMAVAFKEKMIVKRVKIEGDRDTVRCQASYLMIKFIEEVVNDESFYCNTSY